MNLRHSFTTFLAVTTATVAIVQAAPGVRPGQKIQASQQTFRLALPGYRFSFPRDHASHPAYATEWWYFTGHLQAKNGREFGYQLTFFRIALTPGIQRVSAWAARDVIIGHLAVTDISRKSFYFDEGASRAAAGLAGATTGTTHIWLRDWDLKFSPNSNAQQFRARGKSADSATKDTPFSLDLRTQTTKKPVVHGLNGVSQKSAGRGQASHYYSFTRLRTIGALRIGDEHFTVTGQSWFDHEFGSNQLAKNQTGWDWFSLQLQDGRELMLYQLRTQGGGIDPYSSGTLVSRDGQARHLRRAEFTIQPQSFWSSPSGARYPSGWKVAVPGESISLTVTPQAAAQELRTRTTGLDYWEGAVSTTGSTTGKGYVELTGYGGKLGGKF